MTIYLSLICSKGIINNLFICNIFKVMHFSEAEAWALERTPNIIIENQELGKVKSTQGTIEVLDLYQVTIQKLINEILGDGTEIRNVKYTGANNASGYFEKGMQSGIGLEKGIILTTGDVRNAVGPNNSNSKSKNNGIQGDSDLTALVGRQTYDASVLEFEFKPVTSSLSFEYVFASEEYNEFVGSMFNDVFSFFVNGENIAIIPGTNDYVSINNINNNLNSEYYIDNNPSNPKHNIQYDGFTKVFTAKANVSKNSWNKIKIAIADTSDSIYDSGVLIKSKTFSSSHRIIFNHVANQEVNKSFSLNMSVVDQFGKVQTDVKGEISLSSTQLFGPKKCGVSSGVSSCNLTFYTFQNNLVINATIDHNNLKYSGSSNAFNVIPEKDAEPFPNPELKVRVVDPADKPVANAVVTAKISNFEIIKHTGSDGYASFHFEILDKFDLSVEKKGFLKETKTGLLESGLNQFNINLTPVGHNYVVLIPGIFGSHLPVNFPPASFFPRMPLNYSNSSDFKLFWPSQTGFSELKNELEKYGYQVKEFPYDWRLYPLDSLLPGNKSVVQELQDEINKIKKEQPNSTIDFVSHSLGGLVALAYISEFKMESIDKIVTVGTPFKGTLNLFPIVGKGDILMADMLVKEKYSDDFYSKTVNDMYKKKENKELYKYNKNAFSKDHYEYLVAPNDIKDWLTNDKNTTITKIGYPTLNCSFKSKNPPACASFANIDLERLYSKNLNEGLSNINANNFKIYSGKGTKTIRHFIIGSEFNISDPYVIDKINDVVEKCDKGDGLTHTDSIPFDAAYVTEKVINGLEHKSVIKNFSSNIVGFLNKDRNMVKKITKEDYVPKDIVDTNSIGIFTTGFVSPSLSVNGQQYGYRLDSNEFHPDDYRSSFFRKDNISILSVKDILPSDVFSLVITATLAHNFNLEIEGIMNSNEFMLSETLYYHNEPIVIEFRITQDGHLNILNLPPYPDDIKSQSYGPADQLTRITWNAVKGVKSYRIYTKTDKDPKYVFEVELDGGTTKYDTSDSWGKGESKYYRISAVDYNGNESFLTPQVTNKNIKQYFVPESRQLVIPAINLLLSEK